MNQPGTPAFLIVDDDEEMGAMLRKLLRKKGIHAHVVQSGAAALDAIDLDPPAVLVTDVRLGDVDGIELAREAMRRVPTLTVLVMTGFGSMDLAVKAMRAGAFDFVTKPVELKTLDVVLDRAARQASLQRELVVLREQGGGEDSSGLIGSSDAMREVIELTRRVAGTDLTVLIQGESGTGKERIARSLHDSSDRDDAPFEAVNCGAIPANLLESELFGHVKGAFTDARRDRDGLFVRAEGGTVLLDEVGEMSPEMQVKLLRVLQERTVRPVGGDRAVAIDVRVLAATHRNLLDDVRDGRFREDLYYRLNVMQIDVPPLRERGLDVLELANAFARRFAGEMGRAVTGLSEQAARCLLAHHWPGNVRELENAMRRAVALARYDEIVPDDLPPAVLDTAHRPREEGGEDSLLPMAEVERRHILHALEVLKGNKARTARILGLDRKTLYRKLKQYER